MSDERGAEVLGRAVDVYLNDATFWRGVPEAVWNYHIGGYQILKKWLSYREETILGRPLVKDEAREFTAMVRRISAIVLMTDVLDSNYMAVRDASIALSTANPVSVPQIEDPQATGAESAPI
ncbi:type ISP restriction/modification enzyme [Devosia sp. 1566]|uniref:type ISP restriction/modification enzyme n=1 Tax=Devosia sp. 1566 TaxID=2499144 RepID=UPI000FDBFF4E|nr:type ISP restriction/modification enzyme [Devosia sp. 1566]